MLKTCKGCSNLEIKRLILNTSIVGCKETGYAVPSVVKAGAKETEITYTRVPDWCPRPHTEVDKREKPLPRKSQETQIIAVEK